MRPTLTPSPFADDPQPTPARWSQALRDAQDAPWRHSLLGLLRQLEQQDAMRGGAPRIGLAQRPQQEGFRLGQQASLAFAPREIASVHIDHEQVHLRVFGLGVLGPNGALPIHMTEWVRERSQAKRDHTLADFIDLFHHRYFTHLYRAWAQAQASAGLDRAHDETFTRYIARLAGDEPHEVQGSALSPHARWASSAHRVRSARDPDGLVSTLARYFGVPVRLHEFRLNWVPLDVLDQTQLGRPRASALLGQGAVAGQAIADRQSRFRLSIGPLDMQGYQRLTPQGSAQGKDLPALIELVRSFVGFEYAWELELLIHTHAAPPCRLGDGAQLGWSSWMGHGPADQAHISGMLIEPEAHAHKAHTRPQPPAQRTDAPRFS